MDTVRIQDLFSVLLLRYFAEDLGNNVIRTANEDSRTQRELEVLALNIPDIVQRTILHRDPGKLNRLYTR